MEDAWRAHVDSLTPAQLSSPDACSEHLNKFNSMCVSSDLACTWLDPGDAPYKSKWTFYEGYIMLKTATFFTHTHQYLAYLQELLRKQGFHVIKEKNERPAFVPDSPRFQLTWHSGQRCFALH